MLCDKYMLPQHNDSYAEVGRSYTADLAFSQLRGRSIIAGGLVQIKGVEVRGFHAWERGASKFMQTKKKKTVRTSMLEGGNKN